ncbi:MAG: rod-binding protein [Defluviitaleaceae bacterium]|nr:rod-binding protein [Defluviitaleaceae bacterium]
MINPISNTNLHSGISAQFEAARMSQEQNSFEAALNNAQNDLQSLDDVQLRKATKEFEAFFLNMMFREMRSTVGNEHSFLPQSNAERVFQEMLDEEKARAATAAGGIGLADMMFRQIRGSMPIPPSNI